MVNEYGMPHARSRVQCQKEREGGSGEKRGENQDIYLSRQTRHTRVCREKRMLVATKVLLQQNIFVVTKLFSRQIFVATNNFFATKVLSRQAYFCRDKHVFVATKHIFCRDKNDTCGSSRQG